MDNVTEISDVIRRVSLANPEEFKEKFSKDTEKPKDVLYIVHAMCLFFGIMNILPLVFFTTGYDYWMHKFRDVSKDEIDLNNKTTLQTYFASGIVIVQTVPSIFTMLLSTTYGHRFKVNSRIILTLSVKIIIFIVFTIFIKVNTDQWQLAFFIMTLSVLSVITGVLNLFQVSSTVLIPKLPTVYMKTFLFGQGMSSIFSATLQLISLALGTSSETSALVYFVSGTSVIIITLALYLISKRTAFYQHYIPADVEDKHRVYSKEEVKEVFFKIWPLLTALVIVFLTMFVSHPCITSLVVSENYGQGNRWNDVYFTAGITFFFAELCSQSGRLLARPVTKKSNGIWVVALASMRLFVLVPLVWLSNAQPRNNLPVLLTHDWEYILLCLAYFLSAGYVLNTIMLSVVTFAPGQEELGFLITLSCLGVASGTLSPLSLLAVKII